MTQRSRVRSGENFRSASTVRKLGIFTSEFSAPSLEMAAAGTHSSLRISLSSRHNPCKQHTSEITAGQPFPILDIVRHLQAQLFFLRFTVRHITGTLGSICLRSSSVFARKNGSLSSYVHPSSEPTVVRCFVRSLIRSFVRSLAWRSDDGRAAGVQSYAPRPRLGPPSLPQEAYDATARRFALQRPRFQSSGRSAAAPTQAFVGDEQVQVCGSRLRITVIRASIYLHKV